jgi:putative transposase
MAEYRHSAHAVFDLKYHVIWCTKYRNKILRGRVAERARDLIRQICQARDVVIVRGAVSPDHIHLLLSAPPILSPAKLAQYIKGRSSRHLQAEFPELRKRYWGQHMWARGYFCATVGAVDEATIKAYIETRSGTKTTRASRSQRPPSLEPALSRSRLQTASAATLRLSVANSTGFQPVGNTCGPSKISREPPSPNA